MLPMQSKTQESIRQNCVGTMPLDAIIEPWMKVFFESDAIHPSVTADGSPLNVLNTQPFARNIKRFNEVADAHGLDFKVYFARKANKCLSFVDATKELKCGVDVASLPELDQTLARGVDPTNIFCTAAIKSTELIRRCVNRQVVMAIDNLDELDLVQSESVTTGQVAKIALRISGFQHDDEKLFSRFGFDVDEVVSVVESNFPSSDEAQHAVKIVGLHFHLDGYCHLQRVSAVKQSLQIVDGLRQLGHDIRFLDIGGGIPMTYLESPHQWQSFWRQLKSALAGQREPVTYRNHGLGLLATEHGIVGSPKSYPYFCEPLEVQTEDLVSTEGTVQASWLHKVLGSPMGGTTVASEIRKRHLQLRIEPGRTALDGCGMTIAKVEFCKQHPAGHTLIGLAMNHTQCRTSSADFLVDPVLIPVAERQSLPAIESGYLVGAYCTESELLCKRALTFPRGITRGDLVVFPNTAGYFMHFLESRSHQFPLAKNVFVDEVGGVAVDSLEAAQATF